MTDLAVGQEAEVKVQKYLESLNNGCHYVQSTGKNTAEDLYCLIHGERIEVKNDRRAGETGNVVFEKNLFSKTKSETVVYVIGAKAYFFGLKELWEAIKGLKEQGRARFLMGGDRNANPLLLVKTADILPFATEINLGEIQ